jgi:hypothetical protein
MLFYYLQVLQSFNLQSSNKMRRDGRPVTKATIGAHPFDIGLNCMTECAVIETNRLSQFYMGRPMTVDTPDPAMSG